MKQTIYWSVLLFMALLFIIGIDSNYFRTQVYAQINTAIPQEKKQIMKENDLDTKNAETTKKDEKQNDKTKEQKNLPFFNNLNITGSGNVFIKQGDTPRFTVEADQKLLPSINVYVKDQTLYLNFESKSDQTDPNINYYITVRDLKKINSYVASNIVIEEPFETDIFELGMLGGFGDAKLNLRVNKLITHVRGAGKITVRGVATEQNLKIQGVGEFMGNHLLGDIADVTINGSGVAKVNVKNTLKINLLGDGVIEYCGDPQIEKIIDGKGQIKSLEASECQP